MLSDSSILLTGGTGSFGNMFTKMTLKKFNPKKIIIYSRDEMKQWEMQHKFKHDPRVQFLIGDVRDKERLVRALDGIESSDFTNEEASLLKNILGSMNLSYPKKNNLKGGYKKRKSTKKSKKSNKSKNKKNKKSKLRKIKVY